MTTPKIIPRRRVRVVLQLADGTTTDGEAYVAVRGNRGSPELLLDRLNDASERFLPIAVAERHHLIRKSAIVSALTADEADVAAVRRMAAERRLHVEIRLTVGSPVDGSLPATVDPEHDRALDHLNTLQQNFVALVDGEGLAIVNLQHVVRVTERAPTAPRVSQRDVATPRGVRSRPSDLNA